MQFVNYNVEIDYKAIGERIRNRRLQLKQSESIYTQEYIANAIGKTVGYISNIERGTTKLSLPVLIQIANCLKTSVDTLLMDNVTKSEVELYTEINKLLANCTDYESHLLLDLLHSTKDIIRKNQKYLK